MSAARPLPIPHTAPGLPGWRQRGEGVEITCFAAGRCRTTFALDPRLFAVQADGVVMPPIVCPSCGHLEYGLRGEYVRLENFAAIVCGIRLAHAGDGDPAAHVMEKDPDKPNARRE